MKRIIQVFLLAGLLSCMAACDGRKCDEEGRAACDNAASGCISSKCDGMEGADYAECFEVLCVPTLCECQDLAGCAWQYTYCDDMITD